MNTRTRGKRNAAAMMVANSSAASTTDNKVRRVNCDSKDSVLLRGSTMIIPFKGPPGVADAAEAAEEAEEGGGGEGFTDNCVIKCSAMNCTRRSRVKKSIAALAGNILQREETDRSDDKVCVEVSYYTRHTIDVLTIIFFVRVVSSRSDTGSFAARIADVAANCLDDILDDRPKYNLFVAGVPESEGRARRLRGLVESMSCLDDVKFAKDRRLRVKSGAFVEGTTKDESMKDDESTPLDFLDARFVVPIDFPGLDEAVTSSSDEEDEEEEEKKEGHRGELTGFDIVGPWTPDEDNKERGGPPPPGPPKVAHPLDRVIELLPEDAALKVRTMQNSCFDSTITGGNGASKKREWLQFVERLPLGKMSRPLVGGSGDECRRVIERVKKDMDEYVFGLDGAKDVVTELAARSICAPNATSRALLIEGPPGCGKTTFATHAIGAAMNRPVRVINLGGAKDASTLVGHSYTYEGSRPGRVIEEIVSSGVIDPVLVFDEVDKISDTHVGQEIVNILMRIVDPAQNRTFSDVYLSGIPLDLSRVFVVFLCNDANLVNHILLDRVRCLKFPDMDVTAKKKVVHDYMIPRVAKDYGDNVKIGGGDMAAIVEELVTVTESLSGSGGMRTLEKTVERMFMVANLRCLQETREDQKELSMQDVRKTLAIVRREMEDMSAGDRVPYGMYL